MTRTRGNDTNLHPRLAVVRLGPDDRALVRDALTPQAFVVDRKVLEEQALAAAERRHEDEAEAVAVADRELQDLEEQRLAAEIALADVSSERDRLTEAAEWCAEQPDRAAASEAQVAVISAEIAAQSRRTREATKTLERVLEQRAAADAALEDARRELSGLGATGIDETDVRRQMEEASHDLRAASTEYQKATDELARALAAETELDRGTDDSAPATAEFTGADQFHAMGRALRAKFEPAGADRVVVTPTDRDHVRAEVRAAQERADSAARQLAAARQRIEGFETELVARSTDDDARNTRHEAALALEAQVLSVERQLAEAEADARSQVDVATRALSRSELALERERQASRDRRRRLLELAELVPESQRPPAPAPTEPVAAAAALATSLRDLIVPLQEETVARRRTLRVLHASCDAMAAEIDLRRARQRVVLAEDRRTALRGLLAGVDSLLVLDDVLGLDGDGLVDVAEFDELEDHRPVLALTDDVRVIGWAIELPAARGRVAHPSEVWSFVEVDLTAAAPSAAPVPDPQPEPTLFR